MLGSLSANLLYWVLAKAHFFIEAIYLEFSQCKDKKYIAIKFLFKLPITVGCVSVV